MMCQILLLTLLDLAEDFRVIGVGQNTAERLGGYLVVTVPYPFDL